MKHSGPAGKKTRPVFMRTFSQPRAHKTTPKKKREVRVTKMSSQSQMRNKTHEVHLAYTHTHTHSRISTLENWRDESSLKVLMKYMT